MGEVGKGGWRRVAQLGAGMEEVRQVLIGELPEVVCEPHADGS